MRSCRHILNTSNMTVILAAGQAFASGLGINPACERLQAGLTEAGQSLDGRLLVAALDRAASAAVATPAGTPAGGAGSGEGLRQARAPGARGQQRGDAGAVHVYQLNMELRLSKVPICAAGMSGQKHMRGTCHCVCCMRATARCSCTALHVVACVGYRSLHSMRKALADVAVHMQHCVTSTCLALGTSVSWWLLDPVLHCKGTRLPCCRRSWPAMPAQRCGGRWQAFRTCWVQGTALHCTL